MLGFSNDAPISLRPERIGATQIPHPRFARCFSSRPSTGCSPAGSDRLSESRIETCLAPPSQANSPAQPSDLTKAQVQMMVDDDMMNLNFEIIFLRCQSPSSSAPGNSSPIVSAPSAGSGFQPDPQVNSYPDWIKYVADHIQSKTPIDPTDSTYAGLAGNVLSGLTPIGQNAAPCTTTNLKDTDAQQGGLQASADAVGKKLVSDFVNYGQTTRDLAVQYLRSKPLP